MFRLSCLFFWERPKVPDVNTQITSPNTIIKDAVIPMLAYNNVSSNEFDNATEIGFCF